MKRINQQQLILSHKLAPGDIMMMTAMVRDLHRCYPNRYLTDVDTTAPELWINNPYRSKVDKRGALRLKVGYPLIRQSNQCGLHFIQGFIEDINEKLNINVRLTEFRADLHLSELELNKKYVDYDNYWVIISGGKADFTTKWWDPIRYQEVVDKLCDKINFVQIGGRPNAGGARHNHPGLRNVQNLVGHTTLRDALAILAKAKGVITPVTCFMHAAAAFGIPAVVVAGGREHYTWEAYNEETLQRNMAYAAGMVKKPVINPKDWVGWSPSIDKQFVPHKFIPHIYFHSIGKLDCSRSGGCWRPKVTEGSPDKNCLNVIQRPGRPALPVCMDSISVDDVVNAVLSYENGKPLESLIAKEKHVQLPIVITTPKETTEAKLEIKPEPKMISTKTSHLSFPITFCTLTYGANSYLALRCISSVYKHLPADKFKLRLGLNEVPSEHETKILDYLKDKSNVEKVYRANPQIYKYPMMRQMFHDTDLPISTDWILWMDDDSHIVGQKWIDSLENAVNSFYLQQTDKNPKGVHMFGKVYYWHLRGNQRQWISEATWYRNRAFAKDTSKRPPMDKSDFCTGGYWLVSKECAMACDWPDTRLKHRGGDIMMGIAVHQNGYGISQSYDGVKISDNARRGYNETIAGI